jgi:hypothetical protein
MEGITRRLTNSKQKYLRQSDEGGNNFAFFASELLYKEGI